MPEGGDGLELSEAPEVNPDKTTGDEHTIAFEADATQVDLGSSNAAAFTEADGTDVKYTFTAEAKTGYKITSISVYKDSEKNENPDEGKDSWSDATSVATWTETSSDKIAYDADSKTYSIEQATLALTNSTADPAAPENFTIVIKSELKTYEVTVALATADSATVTYALCDSADDLTTATEYTALPANGVVEVTHGKKLALKVTAAAGYEVTGVSSATKTTVGAGEDAVTVYVTDAAITEATTITVSTAEVSTDKYAVIETVTPAEDGTSATISYEDSCVADDGTNKTINGNTDLAFKVAVTTGYTAAVEYQIGTAGTKAVITADENSGVYTLSKTVIADAMKNITEAADKKITIFVTVTKDAEKEYTIKFNTEKAIGAEVKIVKDGESTAVTADGTKLKSGETLTFTVAPGKQTVGGEEVSNKLRYVNTQDNATDAMKEESVEAGVYTFKYTVDENTADTTTIYVSATPVQDIELSFTGNVDDDNTKLVDIYNVTGEGTETSPYVLGTAVENVPAKEDTKVLLVVEPTETSMYVVKSVSLQDSETPAATKEITIGTGESAKTYTAYEIDLTDVSEDQTVEIGLALDDTKANIANFAAADSSVSKDAFQVEIVGEDEVYYHAGERFLTLEPSISFYIRESAGYEINAVEASWTDKDDAAKKETLTADEDSDGLYTLTFDADTKKRDVTITVDISVGATKGNTTVSFNKISDGVYDYKVETADTITRRGTSNIYDLKEGAQMVDFTVYALENFTPVVSYQGYDDEFGKDVAIFLPTPEPGAADKMGPGRTQVTVYPYTYSVPAVILGENNVITMDAKSATRNLDIYYLQTEISELEVKLQNGTTIELGDDADSSLKEGDKVVGERYKVPVNSDVTIAYEANDNCVVESYKIGDAAAKTVAKKEQSAGAFKVSKVTADTRVDINTLANYAVVVKPADAEGNATGAALELTKNAYNVDYTGQYRIAVQRGADSEPIKITGVEVTQSKVTDAAEKAKIAVLSQDNKYVNVKISEADANQTVKVKITIGDGGAEDAPLDEIVTFKVLPKVSKLTITGITLDRDGKGALSQDADSVKDYQIKLTPATANMTKLAVKVLPAGKENPTKEEINTVKTTIADASLDDKGRLTITTLPKKAAEIDGLQKVLVQVVDNNLKDGEAGYVKAEITVTVTASKAVVDATPVATVKSATDTTITLTLSPDKKLKPAEPEEGELWYEVAVSAEGDTTTETAISGAVGTFYIKKADSATQDAALKVSNAELGSGKAWDYKIESVKLVQFTEAMSEGILNDSAVKDETSLANELDLSAVSKKVEAAVVTAAEGKVAFTSNASAAIGAATRTPYYETKLKLKKGKTTVYTGQNEVAIATIQFNNDTTYKKVTVEDISSYWYNGYDLIDNDYGDGMVHLTVKDGTVYMSVDSYFHADDDYGNYRYDAPITGSHTIRVTAKAPSQTYPVYADIKVTVVRGINSIDIVPASTVIYKADKKAATMKVTPVYNEDYTGKAKAAQPKTKKLAYELVDGYQSSTPLGNPSIKINAKNGTITVDKNYNVKDNVSFAVKATAQDFDGNIAEGWSDEITISDKALEIGRLEIVQEVDAGHWDDDLGEWISSTKYDVVAKEGSQVTSGVLNNQGVRVVALKPGTPEKISYTESELWGSWDDENGTPGYAIGSDQVSFKSGNKAVTMTANGTITAVSKVANKITITATANDGGKKKATMKFDVVNAKPAYLGLEVEQQDDGLNNYYEIFKGGAKATEAEIHNINVTGGTADTVLRLSVVQKDEEGDWNRVDQFTNVKLTVSSGTKVLQKADVFNREMRIVANKKTVTVTLENKDVKPTVKQTFTITNPAADTQSLTKFQNVKTTTKALMPYSNNGQEIKYQLNVKDKVHYEYTDEKDQLYVMVRPDAQDRSKNYSRYAALERISSINGTQPVGKDGSFKLYFNSGYLTPGTYKLQLTFGKSDNNLTNKDTYGSFIAESRPQTITVKVNASKTKVTFKPATTLTMSLKDKASVALTGSGKNYDTVEFSNLQNINSYGTGKSKNDEEQFTTYFELVGDNKTGYAIKLKDELTDEQLALITDTSKSNKKAQNARTAYIDYMAWHSNWEVTSSEVQGTVKITVKFVANDKAGNLKPAATYSLSATPIVQGNTNTAISVTAAKKPAEIAYAAVNPEGSEGGFDIATGAMNVWDDTFVLSANEAPAANKNGYTVKVRVIPADAHDSYLRVIREARQAWMSEQDAATKATKAGEYKTLILKSKAAIELTVKVKVYDKNDANVKKITIAASELKKSEWGYSNDKDKNYWSHVYYTKATCDTEIFKVTASFKNADLTATYGNVVSFGDVMTEYDRDGNPIGEYFDIVVNKTELAKADDAVKAKDSKKNAYGATIEVTANVSYGKWNPLDGGGREWVEDDSVAPDTFNFKVTLPKKNGNFTETLAKIKAETAADNTEFYNKLYAREDYPGELSRDCKGYKFGGYDGYYTEGDSWTLNGPEDPDHWDEWYDGLSSDDARKQADIYGYINGAIWAVHDAIYELAPEGSETEINMVQHSNEGESITLQPGEFKAPTSTETGKLIIRVQLTDSAIYEYDDSEQENVVGSAFKDDQGNVKPEYRETLSLELTIPKAGEEPSDVKEILKKFVEDAKTNKTYAGMPRVEYDNISADLCKEDGEFAAALAKYPTLRFNMECPHEISLWDYDNEGLNYYYYAQPQEWVDNWTYDHWDEWHGTYDSLPAEYQFKYTYTDEYGDEMSTDLWPEWRKDATEAGDGYIAGVLHVWGIKYGGDEVRVPFIFTIDKLESLAEIETKIKVALGDTAATADLSDEEKAEKVKLTPSNKTTKDEIEEIFKAAYANPEVEASWGELPGVSADAEDKSFQLKPATVPGEGKDGKGSIQCAIKLSREDGNGDRLVVVTIEIPALASADEAVAKVKAAVIDEDTDTAELAVMNIITPIVEKHLAANTGTEITDDIKAAITTEVQEAILNAANAVLIGQPYKVQYKLVGDTDPKPVFTFKPYTYAEDGKISFTLEVRGLTEGVNGSEVVGNVVTGGELTLATTTLNKVPSLITLVQAKKVVQDAIKAMTDLSNNTTSDDVKEAAQNALNDLGETGITVTHKTVLDDDGIDDEEVSEFMAATFAQTGSLTGTLVLSRAVSDGSADDEEEPEPETLECEYEVELPTLKPNDETVVKDEITRALRAIGVTNNQAAEVTETPGTFKISEAREAELIEEAEKVVTGSGYTITVDESKASTVTKATVNAAGSATISFILAVAAGNTDATLSGGNGEFTVTITIKQLFQNITSLVKDIEAYLKTTYPNNEVKLPDSTTADDYCTTLANAILTAVTATDFKNNNFTVKWDDDDALHVVKNSEDEASGYAGTLRVVDSNNRQKTVSVTLTIAAAEEEPVTPPTGD
ncbi:MAG: hypothetical protein NC419_10835 [Muribaculaceae bacterium]|nr:hypothetical protein [Muribaculaceae bacterium]